MDLSKEQIKKILDEAPEGATDWCICSIGSFSDEYGFNGYCLHGGKFTSAVWNQIPLSDLRKQLEGEWVNGLPTIGFDVMVAYTDGDCDEWCEFHGPSQLVAVSGDYCWIAHHGCHHRIHKVCNVEFRKVEVETEAEKVERERLESAKCLYSKHCGMLRHPVKDLDNNNELLQAWLAIVDKTNYRKGVE